MANHEKLRPKLCDNFVLVLKTIESRVIRPILKQSLGKNVFPFAEMIKTHVKNLVLFVILLYSKYVGFRFTDSRFLNAHAVLNRALSSQRT